MKTAEMNGVYGYGRSGGAVVVIANGHGGPRFDSWSMLKFLDRLKSANVMRDRGRAAVQPINQARHTLLARPFHSL